MSRKLLIYPVLILTMLFFAACSEEEDPVADNDPAIVGEWVVEEVNGSKTLIMEMRFSFMSTSYKLDMFNCHEEGNWSTLDGVLTMESTSSSGDCGSGGTSQLNYSVSGGKLTLESTDGRLVLVKASSVSFGQDEALVGTWTYQTMDQGDGQAQDVSSLGLTLTFSADGYSTDAFGCSEEGSWKTAGGMVGMTPESQSGTDCDPGDIGQTKPFEYLIEGDNLTLSITDQDRGLAIVLTLTMGAPATYSSVQAIFDANCSCHLSSTGTNGVSLMDYDSVIASVGTVAGTEIVVAGDAANSVLIQRLTGEITPQMPLGGTLDDADIDTIKAWIDAGAENN